MIDFWSDREKVKLASRMEKEKSDKESELQKIKNKYEDTYKMFVQK